MWLSTTCSNFADSFPFPTNACWLMDRRIQYRCHYVGKVGLQKDFLGLSHLWSPNHLKGPTKKLLTV